MGTRADERKRRERFLLERFIDASKLAVVIVEEREAPDFVVRFDGRPIGVEVTELFISRGADTLQASEAISSRIASAAQALYQASGAPPAHVSIVFAPRDLRRLNRDSTARQLAAFVHSLDLTVWQAVEWRWDGTDRPLPEEISYVRALGVPSFDMAHWGVPRAGWVAPLEPAPLQARVDEKAKRLPKYRDTIAENWLLVVADAMKPSQLIDPTTDFDPQAVASPFARTFFYKHPDGAVVEIGVSRKS